MNKDTKQDISFAVIMIIPLFVFMVWHSNKQHKFEKHYDDTYQTHDDYLKANLPIDYE